MKPHCEIVVWYVVPVLRSQLAKELLSFGMTQKQVSELLDITQPAVSQYRRDKRGSGIKLNDEIMAMISELANDLIEGNATKVDILPRNCAICKKIDILEVLEQLGLSPNEFGEDCSSCISSKV